MNKIVNIDKAFENYNRNYKDDVRLKNIKKSFLSLFNRESNNNIKPIVIYGAGVVTLPAILELLEDFKIVPVAIIDSDKNKWGRNIADISVNSLKEVYCTYGIDVTVIIAVRGNRDDMLQINNDLEKLGYINIIQCSTWLSYREILKLKDYNLMSDSYDLCISEKFKDVMWLYNMLEDELSKKVLEDIVLSRLIPFDYKYQYYETSYFQQNMFDESAYSYVVDCGAYRGDTLAEFLDISNCKKNLKEYHAFEIDPINIDILNKSVSEYNDLIQSKVHIHSAATSELTGEIKICADGSIGSYVSENGNMTIKAVALDDIMENIPVTLIKMDIEGAEQSALLGAQKIIKKHRPVLVISLYHKYKDLWEIPQLINNLVDSYVGILRHEGLFEYIYFAIPKEYYLEGIKK